MEQERILVTVRTYPNISQQYIETVCVGGISEDGSWRRLYPVPLRYLNPDQQFRTYDVISVRLRPGKDGRPETRTPDNTSVQIVDRLASWSARDQWVRPTIMPSLSAVREAGRTLAPVRVAAVRDFISKPVAADWSEAEKQKLSQEGLFDPRKPLEKIPFEFRLVWTDGDGAEHDSRYQAWEVGETWRQYRGNYDEPLKVMRDKWLQDICGPKRDLAFFMGNLAAHRNVFMVCGIYNPPKREISQDGILWSDI